MKKPFAFFSAFLFAATCLFSQKPYFQQQANYQINASLDDQKHELAADIRIHYVNNSPDALPEIWMHLWANAHNGTRSGLVKQMLRSGNSKLYFSPDSLLGGYSGLDFQVNGQKVAWKFDPKNPDIAVLKLAEPLLPGGEITISTPFLLKIPGSWSRLGHIGQSYQMTQWFPKPAVYDATGWHAMPYLNMGEFYSEFGNFDVTISLPENYVVAATGVCDSPSEQKFLEKKMAATDDWLKKNAATWDSLRTKVAKKEKHPFPASSASRKTLNFRAENVHDFAWFADKRFWVTRDSATLPSGKRIATWAFFTSENAQFWRKGAFYVKRAVESYSNWVGEYPWPQCSAVHSALSAGGGMEYPMVTVINSVHSAKSLDDVIAHEVGHNWFYGLLASNERDFGWMDEGVNSFYEDRYMRQFWGGGDLDDALPKFLMPKSADKIPMLFCQLMHRGGLVQPLSTTCNDMTELNYGLMYVKPTVMLRWLEGQVGLEAFDKTMKTYFQKWKFRHPQPADFEQVWRDSGHDAGWFFESMRTVNAPDFKAQKVSKNTAGWEIFLKNRGDLLSPVRISAFDKKDSLLGKSSFLFVPEKGMFTTMPFPAATSFVVDNERVTMDLSRKNNSIRTSGIFPKMEPLNFRLLNFVEDPTRTTIGFLPWLGGNPYDGFMVGAAFYNSMLPSRRVQYFVAPGFGFGSKNLVGLADFKFNLLPKTGFLKKIQAGLNGKMFSSENLRFQPLPEEPATEFLKSYRRLVPSVEVFFRHRPAGNLSSSLRFREIILRQQATVFTEDTTNGSIYLIQKWRTSPIHELAWFLKNSRAVNPFSASVKLESQNYEDPFGNRQRYLKSIFEWKNTISYAPKKGVNLRLWGTYFIKNTARDRKTIGFNDPNDLIRGTASLLNRGYNDQLFDELWLGRNEDGGLSGQQISTLGGGFHSTVNGGQAANVGASNSFVIALNLVADLPQKLPGGLPLKPYFDLGWSDVRHSPIERVSWKDNLVWSGGVLLDFKKFSVHFPVKSSRNLENLEKERGNYLSRITWRIEIGRLDAVETIVGLARGN